MRLLLATHNEHKRREFERLLGGEAAIDALGGDVELPPEDGETFAENALGKARAAAAKLGRVAIADDSGIAAEALGGAPGVRSARYAGEHASDQENLDKLLREVARGQRARVRVRDRLRRSRQRRRAAVRGPLRRQARRAAPRRARVRLRPGVPAR